MTAAVKTIPAANLLTTSNTCLGERSSYTPKILIVEDNEDYAQELAIFLTNRGFRASWLPSEQELTERLATFKPDLLLLDQFLGSSDALLLLGPIRQIFDGGIVFLSGNEDVIDRVIALEGGADDFVSKSLGARELVARLRAVMRRIMPADEPQPVVVPTSNAPAPGNWRMDPRRTEVRTPDGSKIRLTHSEFETLKMLARAAGQLVTRDEISINILHRKFLPLDRSVDNIVSRIRKLLEPHCKDGPAIVAVRGQGYVFYAFDPSITDQPLAVAPS